MSAKKAAVPASTSTSKKKTAPVVVAPVPTPAPVIIPVSLPPLVSLRVGNFRALREANVVFPDGLVGIVGRNGRGKCLPGWVRVYDPDAEESLPIEQFVAERRKRMLGVVKGKVVPVPVVDWHETGVKPTVELRLSNGVRWETSTTHPVLTPEGCVRAEDLRPGMWVAEVRNLPGGKLPKLTNDEAMLAGLLLGDGCLRNNFSLSAIDPDVIDAFRRTVQAVLPNTDIKCYDKKRSNWVPVSVLSKIEKKAYALRLRDKILAAGVSLRAYFNAQGEARLLRGEAALKHWTISKIEEDTGIDLWEERCAITPGQAAEEWATRIGIAGHGSWTKSIPGAFLMLPEEQVRHMLAGLWMTDGYVSGERSRGESQVNYTSASRQLAQDVRALLLRLGIPSTLSLKAGKYWTVSVLRGYIARFAELVPLVGIKRERMEGVLAHLSMRPRNPNSDVIPPAFLADLPASNGHGRTKRPWIMLDSGMSRDIFRSFGGSSEVADSDLSWVRVKDVTVTGREVETFDVTVDTEEHLYVADTFVVHNSSFLKSITFALYAMAGVPSKWRKERLITRDTEVMKVELVFTVAGQQYTVTRILRRKGLTIEATLEREGLEPITGNDIVTGEIVRLLGAADKLTISRFVSQKEVNALTVMDPAPRKRLILGLLGVEGVEGAIKALRDQVTEFTNVINARKKVLPDVETLVADREAVLLTMVGLAAQRRELEAEAHAVREALAAAEAELERRKGIEISVSASATTMELMDEQLADLATQEAGLDAREAEIATEAVRLREVEALLAAIESHRTELAEAEEAAALVRRKPELVEQQGKLDVRIATDRRAFEIMERTAAGEKSLAAEEKKLMADISRLSGEFAAAEGTRGERRAELMRINNELELLRVQQAAIGVEPIGACPTCGQTIADEAAFREHLAERERELEVQKTATTKTGIAAKAASDEAKARQTAAETRLTSVRTELEAARAAAGELRLARASLEAYETQHAQNAAELATLEGLPYDEARHATLVAENESVPELTKEQGNLRVGVAETARLAADRARIAERRAGYQARHAEAAAAAAAAGYDREATEAAAVGAEAALEEVHASDLRLEKLAGEDARAGDALAHADAAMAHHGQLTAEIDLILADRAAVDLTRQAMERFKIDLIGRIRPALSRKASELLREMTDGEYADLVLDEDYGISIGNGSLLWDPGEPSGGEDDLANLCLRLAISELIGESSALGPSFVVLDEVLGSQDDERRELVMAALPRLTGHFRQILMVAHVPGVQDRFQVVIPAEWDPVTRTSRFFYPPRDESLVATAD